MCRKHSNVEGTGLYESTTVDRASITASCCRGKHLRDVYPKHEGYEGDPEPLSPPPRPREKIRWGGIEVRVSEQDCGERAKSAQEKRILILCIHGQCPRTTDGRSIRNTPARTDSQSELLATAHALNKGRYQTRKGSRHTKREKTTQDIGRDKRSFPLHSILAGSSTRDFLLIGKTKYTKSSYIARLGRILWLQNCKNHRVRG